MKRSRARIWLPHLAIGISALVLVLATEAYAVPERAGIPPAAVRAGDTPGQSAYEAVIRRTAYGVAHVQAADLPSLGFGEGYAQAEDHLCTIADQIVLARGERATHYGRGDSDRHLISDIAMRALRLREGAEAWHAAQPAEVRGWVEGFVAGYNQYLTDTGADAVPGWCRGEPWVVPISAADLAAYHRMLTQSVLAASIAAARLPAPGAMIPGAGPATASARELDELFGRLASVSNGWAFGRDRTRSGGGLLVANPHYPWIGSNRFWEKHLTIPGELDVYGANLIGVPGVLVGFNERVAWTHTGSAASTLTLYALDLVPGQPTRYRYGDEERAMEALELTIPVRGEAEPVRHTAWRSHYGPVQVAPPIPWSAQQAFTMRDATERHPSYLAQILATSRAASLEELQHAHAEHQALNRFTTVAVDAGGTAWFLESAATPDLDREALAAWADRLARDPLAAQLWQVSRLAVLDGSDPRFEWRLDPESPHPGVVPFRRLPQLERTDFVFNANNSFWVAHPAERIEGDFSPLHGAQRAPLELRARQTGLHLSDRGAARVGRAEEMEAALSNRSLAAHLLRDELVERCRATPVIAASDRSFDLAAACDVLAAWDGRYDLDSRGAVLFREWLGQYDRESTMRVVDGRPNLFAVDFDPDDPLGTPRGLAPGALALENLAKAAALLAGRGVALDTPLGELQYAPSKLPRRLPVHGGNHWEGVMNLMLGTTGGSTMEPMPTSPQVPGSRFLTEAGYPVLHGSSFVMAVEFTEDGPRADAILSYGQSGDPESVHFTDQTEMFARKEWRPVLFRADDIAREVRREYTVRGRTPGAQ
jgi:acyl-homoserine-lactone acylase